MSNSIISLKNPTEKIKFKCVFAQLIDKCDKTINMCVKLHKHFAVNSDAKFAKKRGFCHQFLHLSICFPYTFVWMSFMSYVYQLSSAIMWNTYSIQYTIFMIPNTWQCNVQKTVIYTRIVQSIQVIAFKRFVITRSENALFNSI